jgi:hypothetical protein
MAWPDAVELKQVLDITSDDWDETVDRVLASAIAQVKRDVGYWDEYVDEPDDKLSQAALRMGELIGTRPNGDTTGLSSDPTYRELLTGHRRVFGIA